MHVTDTVVVFYTQEADRRRFPWNISTSFTMHCESINSSVFHYSQSCNGQENFSLYTPCIPFIVLWLWIHFHRERYRHNSSSMWNEGTRGSRGTFTLVVNYGIAWGTSYFNSYWNRKFYKLFLSVNDWIA